MKRFVRVQLHCANLHENPTIFAQILKPETLILYI